MKKSIILVIVGALALTLSSCSNDNETATSEQEQEALDASIRESLKTRGIMNALCQIDTLDNGKLSYTPRIGKALESATPTVYYTIGYDLEDARQTFNGIIVALNEDKEKELDVDEVRQGNIHLKFSESNTPGELARITVDCPDLKDVLTEIVFITEERWPANDGASSFNLLSIWRYQNRIYVCVRDAHAQEGIMLTFDGGWSEDWFKKYSYWQGEFYLWEHTASSEAIKCVSHLLRYSNPNYKKMLDTMQERVSNPSQNWEGFYLGYIYLFDHEYTYDHGLWNFFNCYYVDIKRSSINEHGKYNYSEWTSHSEHDNTPRRTSPSHEIRFNPGFNMSGWECIYKGGTVEPR